ncbi:MAG: hypothetical protein MUF14_04715 [Hyphomonadaceae bacterium]|nr:hypothetical protein [Hyphomonadaceae bacterium]
MSDIMVDPSLGHVLFIVTGAASAQNWSSVAGLWASNRKRAAGPALCIINHAGPVPADCQWLDDGSFIGPAESLLMARTLRREPPLLAEAADQVAIECASGDLAILETLLSLPEPERFMPEHWLSRQPPPSTARTLWRGRETENAIRVAVSDRKLIRSRIWRGQMQILFPWMEQLREQFIARHGARIDAGFRDQNGQPLDVVDYEWGHLTTALQRQRHDILALNANIIRILRNALAHSDPVDYQLASRALSASQKLMSSL